MGLLRGDMFGVILERLFPGIACTCYQVGQSLADPVELFQLRGQVVQLFFQAFCFLVQVGLEFFLEKAIPFFVQLFYFLFLFL